MSIRIRMGDYFVEGDLEDHFDIHIPSSSQMLDYSDEMKINLFSKLRYIGTCASDLYTFFRQDTDIDMDEHWITDFELDDFRSLLADGKIPSKCLSRIALNGFLSKDEVSSLLQIVNEYHVVAQPILRGATSLRRMPKATLRNKIIERDGMKCRYCGRQLGKEEITIDHIVPYSLGGKTEFDNLVVSCRPCNSKKGGRLLDDVQMSILEVEDDQTP
jgi:hypothetical protein